MLKPMKGKIKRIVTKIEYHTADGVEYYEKTPNGEVILDAEKYLDVEGDGILLPHFTVDGEPGTWGRVPLSLSRTTTWSCPTCSL